MLQEINHRLQRIEALLKILIAKDTTMAKTLADLTADVAATEGIDQSIVTLLTGLSAQIAALKTTQTDPATAAAIDALATQVEAQNATMTAAALANPLT